MAAAQNKLSARPKVATSEDNRDAKLFAQGLFPDEQMPSAGKLTCSPDSMDVLTLHAAVVFLAMFIGIEFWQAVTPWMLANLGFEIQRFVWCMAVGIIFQVIYERLVFRQIIPAVLDSAIMSRLQGIVLDFLIVSAMSTLNVATIWDHLLPATIASVVGLAWLGFATWWLADYFLPDYHFERAICEYGQTTGVISSGLVLLKMCDPNQRLPVMESFALKNFAAMPFMFTWLPLTIPIMDGSPTTGPVTVLLISLALMFLCVVTWYFYYLPIFKRTPPAVLDDGLDPDRSSATARYSRGSVSFL